MASKRKSMYPGVLGKRATVPMPSMSEWIKANTGSESAEKAFLEKVYVDWHVHQVKGVLLLLDHYKIPESDNFTMRLMFLAIKLGEDHVPYFRAQEPRRRGRKVNREKYLRLEFEVAAEKRPTDKGDLPALTRLAGKKPAPGSVARGTSDEVLRKQLQRARKDPVVSILRRVSVQKLLGLSGDALIAEARKLGHI